MLAKKFLVCFIISVAFQGTACSQSHFLYRELEEVVSNEIIKAIVKDTTGYIWLATDQGVVNFDGITSSLYSKGLKSPFIKDFLVTSKGRVLVLNDLGVQEVHKFRDTVFFEPFKFGKTVYDSSLNYPKSIYEDHSGTIWVGEVDAVCRISQKGFRRFELGPKFQSISYHRTFLFDEDAFNHLWIAPYKGSLLTYNREQDEIKTVPVSLPVSNVSGFCVVKGDYLAIGGNEGLFLIKIDSDKRILETTFIDDLENISCMEKVGDEIFIGTWDKGLYRFSIEHRKIQKIEQVEFKDMVNFHFDPSRNELWVVGSENVGLFSKTPIFSFDNVGEYRVESLTTSGTTLYYSIGQEIRQVGLTHPYEVKSLHYSTNKFFDYLVAEAGGMWIGDSFGAIYRYDMELGVMIKEMDSTGRAVKSIFIDSEKNKWFCGAPEGLLKIDQEGAPKYYSNIPNSIVVSESPDGVIFCGAYGPIGEILFRYEPSSDQFKPVNLQVEFELNTSISIEDMTFDDQGNLIVASNAGLFEIEKGTSHLTRIELPNMPVRGGYRAVVYHKDILWAASDIGLLAYDGSNGILFNNSNGLPSKILKERSLKVYGDDLLLATAKGLARMKTSELTFEKTPAPVFKDLRFKNSEEGDHKDIVLPYQGRLEVEFVSLSYPGVDIVYQTRVLGLDSTWSYPNDVRRVSLFGLLDGNYTLEVRAMENGYLWSDPSIVDFEVTAPWYKSWWAISLFSIGTLAIFGLGIRIYNMRLIAQKRNLQSIIKARSEEINRQKNEIIEQKNRIIQQKEELIAKNEAVHKSRQALSEADLNYLQLREKQLQDQIEFRNKQITTHTLNIIQKNETLKGLRDKLEEIIRAPRQVPQTELRRTLKIIDESFKLDKDWEEFKLYFEQIYTGFYTKLKINCPSLTNQELRHCALIRLNLSIAECASILGISPDSVKVSRARIRKKLDLPSSQGLTDFILSV